MKQDLFDQYVATAAIQSGISVTTTKLSIFPYYDIIARAATLATVFIAQVNDNGNSHTAVVSYFLKDGEPDFSVWCADKFAEGRSMQEPEARARCEEALAPVTPKGKLVDTMMSIFSSHPESAKCSFWSNWRKDKKLCAHTEALLAHLRDTNPNFTAQLQSAYDTVVNGVAEGTSSDTMTLSELAFRVPVLFEGERGAGKTVTARAFARDNGYKKVEFGGHEGVESPEMLGYLVPVDKSTMVWKDGPISEAFRSAKKQKTVLIMDELLRIRQRELSLLLTAFSPDEGMYRLRTGRIVSIEDGVAQEETLECPVENLCVVATTNVGSEYAVDEIDPALQERFVVLRKDTTESELKRILGQIAKSLGFGVKSVDACVNFFKKMKEARSRGLVKNAPTTRTLARALELAKNEEDIKRAVKTQILLWVARDGEGYPVKEQVEDVEKLIDRCFK